MRYISFKIQNYRAIIGPMIINVEKNSLIPIIGVNECGKSTILQAILAFDSYSDDTNGDGRHLRDTNNLYGTDIKDPEISATFESTVADLKEAWDDTRKREEFKKNPHFVPIFEKYKRRFSKLNGKLTMTRNLTTRKYSIDSPLFPEKELNLLFAAEIIR